METHPNSAKNSPSRPIPTQIWTAIFVAVFVILLFLLGQAMVQHRFFRGGWEQQNGSIGP